MLGFAWFYSSESGLFNGLRPIQIKNSLLSRVVREKSRGSASHLVGLRGACRAFYETSRSLLSDAIRQSSARRDRGSDHQK
jgi:hypothetical protein